MNHPELHESNGRRTIVAAARTVAQACAGIDIIDAHEPTSVRDARAAFRYRHVLKARHQHPDSSLAEIAAALGVSKDTYSAALRRALAYAARLAAAQKTGSAA